MRVSLAALLTLLLLAACGPQAPQVDPVYQQDIDQWRTTRLTRVTEHLLNPVLGKSLVVYLEKPV